jgi:hypothetical protein
MTMGPSSVPRASSPPSSSSAPMAKQLSTLYSADQKADSSEEEPSESEDETEFDDDAISDLLWDHHDGSPVGGLRTSMVQEGDEEEWSSDEEYYDGMRRSLRASQRRKSRGEDHLRASFQERRGSKGNDAIRTTTASVDSAAHCRQVH